MKIVKSVVQKMMILDVKNLDPVAVIVEDQGPGVGKITITCFSDCWSYFWGSVGEQNTLASFFAKCNTPYLAGKLSQGIKATVNDEDEEVCVAHLRKHIVEARREGDLNKPDARALWNSAECPMDEWGRIDPDVFREVFGDDWYDNLPKKTNPDYLYLCRIIDTVKEAFLLEQT